MANIPFTTVESGTLSNLASPISMDFGGSGGALGSGTWRPSRKTPDSAPAASSLRSESSTTSAEPKKCYHWMSVCRLVYSGQHTRAMVAFGQVVIFKDIFVSLKELMRVIEFSNDLRRDRAHWASHFDQGVPITVPICFFA